MRRIVADAATLAEWFAGDSQLRSEYEAGSVVVVGPSHLPADLVGELVATFGLDSEAAARLAREVDQLRFELHDPPTAETARWIARGLDARRAGYAAIASGLDLPLVTADATLGGIAGALATSSRP